MDRSPARRGPQSQSRSQVLRVAVAVLAVASLVHVGILFPRYFTVARTVPPGFAAVAWGVLLTVPTAVAACVLALVLVVRSWARVGARSLALVMALLAAVWGSLLRFLEVTSQGQAFSVQLTAGGWNALAAGLGVGLAVAAFIRFSALFPVPLDPAALRPPRVRWTRRLRLFFLRPAVPWVLALAVGLGPELLGRALVPILGIDTSHQGGWILGVAAVCFGILPLAGIALGLANLRSGYRLAEEEHRREVLWMVAGGSAAGWLVLLPLAGLPLLMAVGIHLGDAPVAIGAAMVVVGPAVFVASAAMALFYAGAIDPALALRRSTVTSILAGAGLLVFAGLENVLSQWVQDALGLPGTVGALLEGVVAAGLMVPLHKGLQRLRRSR